MNKITYALLVVLTSLQLPVFSQDTWHFKNGLVVTSPQRYGREAIYTDLLAYRLYTHQLKTPVDGAVFEKGEDGQPQTWQAVTADSANRLFRRGGRGGAGRGINFGRGGYFYLTYQSDKAQPALLNIKGNSGLYFNGEPHTGDPYSSGWLYIPVQLKKGLNEIYVRGVFITASLSFPGKPVQLVTEDPTMPAIVIGEKNDALQGAVVVINHTSKELKGLQFRTSHQGKELTTDIPAIPAKSSRKVPFSFDASTVSAEGKTSCAIAVTDKGKTLDESKIEVEAVMATGKYSSTFISQIDGSLQYFAVTPQVNGPQKGSALFLSVHGAGVEAIGQARAYQHKDWGTLVAATNRRPRGFNWEDWGRLDALEVLNIARNRFQPDPQHIYLTGHSMGGHGTWFLGATYPDKWAGIAPSAGYPTLKGYGSADGLIPDSSNSPMEQMLLRSGNQSDVIKLVQNYKPLGVYIFHGDADRTVSVNYARQMRELLGKFHPDFSYNEYPGGEHWFGDISVDWKPLFDFFKWHSRPVDTAVRSIDFTTSNPGISASFRWASVQQQLHPLQYSRIKLDRNRTARTITGTTENVRLLRLDLADFDAGTDVKVNIDGTEIAGKAGAQLYILNNSGKWAVHQASPLSEKGPHRYGTLKDAFNYRMIFVYSTGGTKEENEWSFNKARYDAETWYYRGNGAVDIIADKDYTAEKYKDRGVIVYGNKSTNKAWNLLLNDCPIQVERNKVTAGGKQWTGEDLSTCFVWPLKGSDMASVAVISGSGLAGMKAAYANQYFAGASGFPDFMIYSAKMLATGVDEVKMAGFYDNEWKLSDAEMIQVN
ncbi:prolyl oligopeptidase family serine peptidase [Chitinophaga barathri]|uniref:Alpha/beta hydrolase n=1 Tax=Chitinophaga barathri TaxID=1647451 RepID=A0A3N4M968_9BACT|nr:alpha/beta hydrolase-fold protein [Chitinophaga barathri]RPD39968.1 alpha/beta hydrolase [Chitinophaga barathri]